MKNKIGGKNNGTAIFVDVFHTDFAISFLGCLGCNKD